jgi:uncharacterized LabA/DUF88 family protein
MIKVCCYIDGFNIYHAIDEASRASRGALNYLKWVNLHAVMVRFTDPSMHQIVAVKLFTAYPTWNPDRESRHRQFVKAGNHFGVQEILGRFKLKDAYCKICKGTYRARAEKESDVNIAMHLVSDAHEGVFDQAFLVTNDSDLLGPVRMVREKFPEKRIKIISPPFRRHSKELWAAATHRAKILQEHLEACLTPESARDANGVEIFSRPKEYEPPKKTP